MYECPECGANFDMATEPRPGRPLFKLVPAHVAPATCHVAEHLRTLADWLERGDFSTHCLTPDGAVVLLFDSSIRNLTANPIGVEVDAITMVGILQAALESLGKHFAIRRQA
jgi:hypothetical protein